MKPSGSHLPFKKIFIFEDAASSPCYFKEDPTSKRLKLPKLTSHLVASSPSSKDPSSTLSLLSFKKETFDLAASTLVSNVHSNYSLRPKRISQRHPSSENKFPFNKKIFSSRSTIPPFEKHSHRPFYEIGLYHLTSSNIHPKTSSKSLKLRNL